MIDMAALITEPNIERPDDFYAELIALHAGREPEESEAINARLILLLANHIGDRQALREAFDAAVQDDRGQRPRLQEPSDRGQRPRLQEPRSKP